MSVSSMPPAARLPAVLALLEVIAVYAAGAVLGLLLAKLAGVTLHNPLAALAADPGQDLLPISGQLLAVLFWQYVGWLLAAAALRLVRGALPTRAPDQVRPRLPAMRLLFLGLVTASLATIPQRLLALAQHHVGLGETAPWRAALLASEWDLDFWVLMAVGSFGLIPVVEELFYRGWMLARLRATWTTALAVLFIAGLFACSHGQYLRPDALNLLTLGSVCFGATVYACSVVHARSLWPAIIAHAIINIPLLPMLQWVQVAAMTAFLALVWRQWAGFRNASLRLLAEAGWRRGAAAILGGALVGVSMQLQQDAVAVAGLGLWVLLLGGHGLARLRRRWRAHPSA